MDSRMYAKTNDSFSQLLENITSILLNTAYPTSHIFNSFDLNNNKFIQEFGIWCTGIATFIIGAFGVGRNCKS